MSNWFVWTINQQRYKKVVEFLESFNAVEEFLYPTVEKEYETKSGKRFKDVPLYNNYVFIKHKDSNLLKEAISSCMWINDCLGPCSPNEIDKIKELAGKKYDDLMPQNDVVVGESYKLKGTAFTGMTCNVVEKEGDKLTVSVELFGSERFIKCNIDDINLEG